ncbi:MAG TPA: transporter [Xanthobacteraceae bacterium]|nr:transporter [Xanthobacteraceae bacterium]
MKTPVMSRLARWGGAGVLALYAIAIAPGPADADEGGVSFWLPGLYGSLAAAPQQPGWSFADIYYHATVSAGGDVAAAREATIGAFTRTVNINLNASVNARLDADFVTTSYVFANQVLGGQLAVGLAGAAGHNHTSIDGTLTVSVGNLTATRSGSITDDRWGFADLYPTASLRWNSGVNNFMVYLTGDLPVGTYDSSRLANFGIGHGAIDGGFGYTYFNPQTGHEFSFVTGLTGNFVNPSTDYTNGIDWHLDWGASQFLTKQWQIGAVGYFYEQLTGDRGAPLILGENRSGVIGVGPQVGYLFPVGSMQGYLNLKAYWEFDAQRRADGWNTWVTLAISPPAPPAPVATSKPMFTK